jgi:hypothetical protein
VVAVGDPDTTVRVTAGLPVTAGDGLTGTLVGLSVGVAVKRITGGAVGMAIWVGVGGSVGVAVGGSSGCGVVVGVPVGATMREGGATGVSLDTAVAIPAAQPAVAPTKSTATRQYQSRRGQLRPSHQCQSRLKPVSPREISSVIRHPSAPPWRGLYLPG